MGQTDFEDSKHIPEAHNQAAEDQLPRSGDSPKSSKKTKNNQEWGGDIVASGYLMILYQ